MARSLFRPHQVLVSFTGAAGATLRIETAINYEGYPRAALTGLATMKAKTSSMSPAAIISKVNPDKLTGVEDLLKFDRSYESTPLG